MASNLTFSCCLLARERQRNEKKKKWHNARAGRASVQACRRAGGQAFGRAEHATRVACAGRAEYLFLLIKPIDIKAWLN